MGAVRHIDDAIVGNGNAMRRIELLRPRTGDLPRVRGLVVGFVAVGTPVALVGAGVGVKHDHTAVAVSIGNEHLVPMHGDAGWPTEMLGVIAVGSHPALADLQ